MACLYCGKEIGAFRILRDAEFCSTAHRKKYGERLGKALHNLAAPEATPTKMADFIGEIRPVVISSPCYSNPKYELRTEFPRQVEPWRLTLHPVLGSTFRFGALASRPAAESLLPARGGESDAIAPALRLPRFRPEPDHGSPAAPAAPAYRYHAPVSAGPRYGAELSHSSGKVRVPRLDIGADPAGLGNFATLREQSAAIIHPQPLESMAPAAFAPKAPAAGLTVRIGALATSSAGAVPRVAGWNRAALAEPAERMVHAVTALAAAPPMVQARALAPVLKCVSSLQLELADPISAPSAEPAERMVRATANPAVACAALTARLPVAGLTLVSGAGMPFAGTAAPLAAAPAERMVVAAINAVSRPFVVSMRLRGFESTSGAAILGTSLAVPSPSAEPAARLVVPAAAHEFAVPAAAASMAPLQLAAEEPDELSPEMEFAVPPRLADIWFPTAAAEAAERMVYARGTAAAVAFPARVTFPSFTAQAVLHSGVAAAGLVQGAGAEPAEIMALAADALGTLAPAAVPALVLPVLGRLAEVPVPYVPSVPTAANPEPAEETLVDANALWSEQPAAFPPRAANLGLAIPTLAAGGSAGRGTCRRAAG